MSNKNKTTFFDNSLEELLKDNTPRTNEEFKEHLKIDDSGEIDINDVKMVRQPLFKEPED